MLVRLDHHTLSRMLQDLPLGILHHLGSHIGIPVPGFGALRILRCNIIYLDRIFKAVFQRSVPASDRKSVV